MRTFLIITLFLLSCDDGNLKSVNSQESQSEEHEIVGSWIVTGSNIIPFDHISFCKNISLNSVFEFNANGCLKVVDSKTGTYCNSEIQQRYFVKGNVLKMVEGDMQFEYEIQKLTNDTLVLKIEKTPEHYFSDTIQDAMEMESDLHEIYTSGIKVTLVREKSGL